MDNIRALVGLVTSTVDALRGTNTAVKYESLMADLEFFMHLAGFASMFIRKDVIKAIDHLAARCREVVEQIHRWACRRAGADFCWNTRVNVLEWRKELHSFRTDICILLTLSGCAQFEDVQTASRDQVRSMQRQIPASVGYTRENGVELIDALGERTIFPMEFCRTSEKFGAFLRALFLDRPGQQRVERGDYDLTRDEDKQVIRAEEWNTLITPGMVLRMSMILRNANSAHSKEECPTCHKPNSVEGARSGWVECWYCSTQYLVSEMTAQNRADEIVSPASRELEEAVANDGVDEVQFFRNIHLVLHQLSSAPVFDFPFEEFQVL